MKRSPLSLSTLLFSLTLCGLGVVLDVVAHHDGPTRAQATAPNALSVDAQSPVNDLLALLEEEANRRRAEREARDPQGYARRVDKPLNQNRINFLLFGYGTTYEPPLVPRPQYKGSIAIYSLDLRTLQISAITLNHDIRTPEIEHYVRELGNQPQPLKMHFAYPLGGFELMRLVAEDATGLAVDFQLAFQDSVVKDFVDEVLGGLSVNVPFTFDAEAMYFQDAEYPSRQFGAGVQRMDGVSALQFIKAIQVRTLAYDPSKELAIRKQIVVQALLDAVKQQAHETLFWGRLLAFLHHTLEREEVAYDFDAGALLFKSIGPYMSGTAKGQVLRLSLGRSLYVVDRGNGDGGVEWVMGSANPIMQNDVKKGLYNADRYLSVPLGRADPDAADLVANYWPSVRQLIRQRLVR